RLLLRSQRYYAPTSFAINHFKTRFQLCTKNLAIFSDICKLPRTISGRLNGPIGACDGRPSRKLLHCQLERRIIDDLAVPNINQVTQNYRIDRNLYRPSARVAKNEGANSGVPTPEIRVIVALNRLVTRLGHGCLRAAISGKATVIVGIVN